MQFESQRLVFEPITQNHAQELAQVLCDSRVYLHVDDGIAPTFNELQEPFSLRESGPPLHRQDEIWVDYIVRIKASQQAIGRVEATVIEHRAEVAYLFGAAYWSKGYGSESLVWLQQFLQQTYPVREFWATVTPGNDRSKRLLLKNAYAEVSSDQLPRLTSYDENDWVFMKLAEVSFNC